MSSGTRRSRFSVVFLFVMVLAGATAPFNARPLGAAQRFRRGDSNSSGKVDISDAVATLGCLFGGGICPECLDAADSNDDGKVDISDPVHTLGFLFLGTPPPPAPFGAAASDCGEDPTADALGCESFAPCPAPAVPPAPPVLEPPASPTQDASIELRGTAGAGLLVKITGGRSPVPVEALAGPDGAFAITVELSVNRLNRLFALVLDAEGRASAPAAVEVTQDSEPPFVYIDEPADGSTVMTDRVTVTGRVSDMLSGFLCDGDKCLSVTVNGILANIAIGIGTNGTFERQDVPLEPDGNTIVAVATDVVGNTATHEVRITREDPPPGSDRLELVSGNGQAKLPIHATLPQPIVVRARKADSTALEGKLVTFQVVRSDGRLASAPGAAPDDRVMTLAVLTGADGLASAYWTLGSDAGCGNNRVQAAGASGAGLVGEVLFCASATPGPAAQINIGSGNNQRVEAGAPAPEALKAWVSDGCNGIPGVQVTFRVTRGTGKVNGVETVTVPTGPTGHAQVSFVLGPEAGNQYIEANFDGHIGSPTTFVAFVLVRDETRPTTFSGLVLDNAQQPIQGAVCILEVPGFEGVQTGTDIHGRFELAAPAAGPASLRVEGSFATHVGGEAGHDIEPGSFPSLVYEVTLIPNAENSLPGPVLLPPLDPENTVVYDGTSEVVLKVKSVEGLEMRIAAGTTVTLRDGTKVGPGHPGSVRLSLNQVHYDDVPMPMPDGAAPPFAWTLQPAGARFEPPVQVRYPNMSGLPPGAITNFLSFNHDTGKFEIVSSGHVSTDGSSIESDPGSGITVAGWGCNCPPYSVTGSCKKCSFKCNGCDAPGQSRIPDCPFTFIPGVGTCFTTACDRHDICYGTNSGKSMLECDVDLFFDIVAICNQELLLIPPLYTRCLALAYIYAQVVNLAAREGFKQGRAEVEACGGDVQADCPRVQGAGHGGGVGVALPPFDDLDEDLVPDDWEISHGLSPEDPDDAKQDSDADGLTSLQEFILDTDPRQGDTDGDGTGDGVEALASQPPKPLRLDDSWVVAVNGQSARPGPIGTFLLSNVAAPDLFGPDGPGTRPDFLSDEFVRVLGTKTVGGQTYYAFSEPFQILQGETYVVPELTITPIPPPLPRSLRIESERSVIQVGEAVQLAVKGTLGDGSDADLTQRIAWTTYRTSNPKVASVGRDGMVTALGRGTVFITAVNEGTTAVKRIDAANDTVRIRISGVALLPDGSLAAGARIRTTFGGETVADADGTFTLEVEVPVGAVFSVIVTYESGGTRFSKTVKLEAREDVEALDLGAIRFVEAPSDLFPGRVFETGNLPSSVAFGDLDGDGDSDLTVTNYESNSISVLRNEGDGTFEVQVQYPVGSGPESVVLGDLDGDGDTDIAVANFDSDTVSVLRNRGDGTFAAHVQYGVGSVPESIALGDLDGDGDPDLAVAKQFSDNVSVLRNNGDGTFAAHVQYGVGSEPDSVVLGDLDGDGDADLAVTNAGSSTVSILLNQGDGTFAAHVQYGVGLRPHWVALGDLDGDGDADLATANYNSDTVSVLLNQGDGTFAAHGEYGVGNGPASVALGDLDGDGDADLAVANQIADTVSIVLNLGDAMFAVHAEYGVGTNATAVALGDLDGDGDADLAVANALSDTVSVLRNQGDGAFQVPPEYAVGRDPLSVAVGDLDGDADADLAVANGVSNSISVLRNSGDRTFADQVEFPVGARPTSVALGDLNGDGSADMAVGNDGSNTFSVLFNQGDGTFGELFTSGVGPDPDSVALGDLDGDGDADLVVGDYSSINTISVFLNKGDATFADPVPYSIGVNANSLGLGDLDRDGDVDLAVANYGSNTVSVLLNQGDGTFAAHVQYDVGNEPISVALGDLDGDGAAELAVANYGSDAVSVLGNRGDGTFAAEVRYGVGGSPRSVAVGDLDRDGDTDLAVANYDFNTVSVLENQGDGSFAARVQYGVGIGPSSVVMVDLDLDGDPDLAVANSGSDTVSVLLNQSVR